MNIFPVSPEKMFPKNPTGGDAFAYAQKVMSSAVSMAIESQNFQYQQKLPLADTLLPGATQIASLQIGPMGPFCVKQITGSFDTLIPDPDNLGEFIDDGVCRLFIKLSDDGRARQFMNDFVPLSLFLTPGNNNLTTAQPSQPLFDPIAFEYVFGRNSKINAQVLNTGSAPVSYSLLFHGIRIIDQTQGS